MVYIYRKLIGGKPYYYLRISARKNGRVFTKDVAYLGCSATQLEVALKNLPKYEREIRKAHKTLARFTKEEHYTEKAQQLKLKTTPFLTKRLQEQAEAVRLHYQDHFKKIDEATKQQVYKQFLIDFAFNTTSIEGNTITLKETHKLLTEDLLPKDKTLREVYDLQNTEKTFFWLLQEQPEITEETIIAIHDKLLEKIDLRKGYRTHDVRVFRSTFEATPAKYVRTDMNLLLAWLHKNSSIHPIALATLFHHKFEKIHPFADGNGRTGRMLLNLILLKKSYPPTIITKKRRAEYLETLRKADKTTIESTDPKKYSDLCAFVSEELTNAYWNNFNA